jgi:hypothetical protein
MASKTLSRVALFGLLFATLLPSTALAYIDPNAGGLLLQLLAPIFAGILGAWVFMRNAIGGFFRDIWRKLTRKVDK